MGFHEKKTGCGWKEANVDGKRRIITWRFNIITGSFHSSKTDRENLAIKTSVKYGDQQ